MKFFTPFLTVLAATSALGLTIPTKRQETGVDDYSYLGTNPIIPVQKECSDAVIKLTEENKDCVTGSPKTEEELKSFCSNFNSDKCQKFINTVYTDLPECKSSPPQQVSLMNQMTKVQYEIFKIECAVDEKGNFCPLTDIESAKKINGTMTQQQQEQVYDELLKENCKSKKCTDIFLSFYEDVEKIEKENQDSKANITNELSSDPKINKTLSFLKSEQCTAEAKSDTVSSMTYTSALFVSLALLLLNL